MDLPLFPLRSVLFPGGPLTLRIFETRYLDMVSSCLRGQSVFGVVLIREGAEVGPVTAMAPVGCSARIVDFEQGDDGLLGILARGERRFRVLTQRRQADGLHRGEVQWLSEDVAAGVPPEHEALVTLLRHALAELGEPYASMPEQFDNAAWVTCRLAEVLPLGVAERQLLLEEDDPLQRLARLASLVRREAH